MSHRNTATSISLALRSLAWTILIPGGVAGYVPWRYFGLSRVRPDLGAPAHVLGLLCVLLGAALLFACIFEFARSGWGTLSPIDPPRRLVIRGLYRYVRNPMYLAVTTILLGETLLAGSVSLARYWIAWFACVNLFVIAYEEPSLRRRFGSSYDDYAHRVGRWVPRRPRDGEATT